MGRTERSSASATAERPGRGRAPTWASQALSRHTNLKMRSFRTSLRCAAQLPSQVPSQEAEQRPVRGTSAALDASYQRLPSKSGTEDSTAFSAVAPSWRPGRRLLMDCVDGTSMKADSSIVRRLIRMRCWFEPLILRLGPATSETPPSHDDRDDDAQSFIDAARSTSGQRSAGSARRSRATALARRVSLVPGRNAAAGGCAHAAGCPPCTPSHAACRQRTKSHVHSIGIRPRAPASTTGALIGGMRRSNRSLRSLTTMAHIAAIAGRPRPGDNNIGIFGLSHLVPRLSHHLSHLNQLILFSIIRNGTMGQRKCTPYVRARAHESPPSFVPSSHFAV
jgi:hypothetical protein